MLFRSEFLGDAFFSVVRLAILLELPNGQSVVSFKASFDHGFSKIYGLRHVTTLQLSYRDTPFVEITQQKQRIGMIQNKVRNKEKSKCDSSLVFVCRHFGF